MAGVWGPGGLFERAVQQKYENQGMNASTDRMNAETNRYRAGNDLTLGLRDANTKQFSADTQRGNLGRMLPRGFSSNEINSLGVSTFNPDTSPTSTSPTRATSSVRPTNYYSGTTASGTPAFGDSSSNLRAFGVSDPEERKFGFGNSGKVSLRMKPRMVRQPGYKNSGKVMAYGDGGKVIPDANSAIREEISKLAAEGDVDGATNLLQKLQQMEASQGNSVKGYGYGGKVMGYENGGLRGGPDFPKSQGPIGNAEADMGQDEVDAVVRPGEYLLNPDTVAAFGKIDPKTVNAVFKPVEKAVELAEYSPGDYDRGVRNLNKIARNVTGREPGPKEMEEGSVAGFANSGAASSVTRNAAGRFGGAVNRVLDADVGAAARRAAAGTARVTATGANTARDFLTKGAGRAGVAGAALMAAPEVYKTDTSEYYNKFGINPNAEEGSYLDAVLPSESSGNPVANAIRPLGDKQFWRDVGVRGLGAAAEVGNNLTFGLLSGDDAQPAPPAAPTQTEAKNSGMAGFMQEVANGSATSGATQQPAGEKQPSLRDFLENQYRELAAQQNAMGSGYRAERMKDIGDMINNMDQTAATANAADVKSLAKAEKDNATRVEKMIESGFTRREVDPETGKITESLDKEAANEFRRQMLVEATRLGIDVSALTPYEIMSAMKDFDTRRGVRDVINQQAANISDGVVSRELLRPDEIMGADEIGLTDTLPWSDSSATFFDDYVPSLVKGGDADKVAVIRRGGKDMRIPLSEMIRRPDGSINQDVLAQYPQLRR